MSSERKENWIQITTPKGERKIASPSYIKNLLELDTGGLKYRINSLEKRIEKLESPARQKRIIDTLRDQGKHNRHWLLNRVDHKWYDLAALIENGTILETRSGTQTMLELKQEI